MTYIEELNQRGMTPLVLKTQMVLIDFKLHTGQFNPLSSDGVYVINGDYRYSIGNNNVTLTDTRTTIGKLHLVLLRKLTAFA